MDFDIQIDFNRLRSQIRAQFELRVGAATAAAIVGVFDIPFDRLQPTVLEPAVVDHLEFHDEDFMVTTGPGRVDVPILLPGSFWPFPTPPGTALVRSPNFLLRGAVRVFFVRLSDLIANETAPTPTERMVEYTVRADYVFGIPTLDTSTSIVTVAPSLSAITILQGALTIPTSLIPMRVQTALQAIQASGQLAIAPITLPLGALLAALNSGPMPSLPPFSITNVALRAFTSLITIRIEIRRTFADRFETSLLRWTDFFNNAVAVANRTGGSDWALFMPSEYFAERVRLEIETGMARRTDVHVNDDNRPATEWIATDAEGRRLSAADGAAGGGRVAPITRFSLKAPGACVPFGFDIDVNIRLDLSILLLQRERTPTLRIEIALVQSIDEGDEILCVGSAAVLFGAFGAGLGALGGGWIGAVVGGVIGNIIGVVVSVGLIEAFRDVDIRSLQPQRDAAGNVIPDRYFAEVPIGAINSASLGSLSATSLVACSDGLAIAGRVGPAPGGRRPEIRQVVIPGFRWQGSGLCPLPGERAVVHAFAGIEFRANPGTERFIILHYEVHDSTPPNIETYMVGGSITMRVQTLTIELRSDELRDLQRNAGAMVPRCRILVQTNVGARIIEVPISGSSLTEDAHDRMRDSIESGCIMHERLIEYFENFRGFRDIFEEAMSMPTPIPGLSAWRFDLAAIGLAPGAPVTLASARKGGGLEALQSLKSGEQGQLYFSLFRLERDEVAAPLGVDGLGKAILEGVGSTSDVRPEVVVTVRRFATVASVPVLGAYRDHAFGLLDGILALVVASDRYAAIYAGRDAEALTRVGVGAMAGVERLALIRGGFVAHGYRKAWQASVRRPTWERLPLPRLFASRLVEEMLGSAPIAAWLGTRSLRCGCRQIVRPIYSRPAGSVEAHSAVARLHGDLTAVFDPDTNEILVARLVDQTMTTPRTGLVPAIVTASTR